MERWIPNSVGWQVAQDDDMRDSSNRAFCAERTTALEAEPGHDGYVEVTGRDHPAGHSAGEHEHHVRARGLVVGRKYWAGRSGVVRSETVACRFDRLRGDVWH
jgi:hypothetical protein